MPFVTDLRAIFRLCLLIGFMCGVGVGGASILFAWWLWLRAL